MTTNLPTGFSGGGVVGNVFPHAHGPGPAWSNLQPGTNYQANLDAPAMYWLTCEATDPNNASQLTVLINDLIGTNLVTLTLRGPGAYALFAPRGPNSGPNVQVKVSPSGGGAGFSRVSMNRLDMGNYNS